MLNNLSKSEKILLIILGAVIILFVYFRFLLSPTINSVKSENAVITDYKNQVNHIKDTEKINVSLKSKLTKLQAKMDETSKALPDSQRIPELERNLKPMIDKDGLAFGSINFGQAAQAQLTNNSQTAAASTTNTAQTQTQQAQQTNTARGSISLMSQPINISCTGDYNSIMKFLDDVERDERLSQIDSVTFSPSGNLISSAISLHYYYTTNSKQQDLKYDFNNGKYGKDDLFK